jgi:16S rRNA (cytosine967-C5)-methyltransferase
VHLAAKPGEISADELAAITGGEPTAASPYGVVLVEGGDPHDVEPIREGLAIVQDEGSQLVALIAARAVVDGRDDRWLDLCAGPGGKAVMLGALAAIEGATLDAVEVAAHRARLVSRAVDDLPVRVHTGDARTLALPEQAYDRVLVDAPCTGLGALRRRPEARWRRGPDDVPGLVTLQTALLSTALERVRPGGVVVYATCSPHPAETVGVVDAVVAATGAVIEDAPALVPAVGHAGRALTGGGTALQLWPHRHGTDAMFCAVLRRP